MRANSGVEISVDANEYDSAHRYLAGDLLKGNVIWQSKGGGYLDYTLTGNGGIGGRDFFRYHASGFVAFRQKTAGQIRYWWVCVGPRTAPSSNWVSYYAGTTSALTATGSTTQAPFAVFPNPAAATWHLSEAATYGVHDCQEHLICSNAQPTLYIEASNLATDLYKVALHLISGATIRWLVTKE